MMFVYESTTIPFTMVYPNMSIAKYDQQCIIQSVGMTYKNQAKEKIQAVCETVTNK